MYVEFLKYFLGLLPFCVFIILPLMRLHNDD